MLDKKFRKKVKRKGSVLFSKPQKTAIVAIMDDEILLEKDWSFQWLNKGLLFIG
jgi:hypothetical protein